MPGSPNPGEQPVRIAIVGCGLIAGVHLKGIAGVNTAGPHGTGIRFEITALVDPNEVSRRTLLQKAKSLGLVQDDTEASPAVRQADALRSVPPGSYDMALVCVPHNLHLELCREVFAVAADEIPLKHCVLEKPLGIDLKQCREMIHVYEGACEKLRKVGNNFNADSMDNPQQGEIDNERQAPLFWVMEQSEYWPEVTAACELIRLGKIGRVVSAHANYYESLVSTPFGGSESGDPASHDKEQSLGWRESLESAGGGAAMDGGLHFLRPLRMFVNASKPHIVKTKKPIIEVIASSSRLGLPRMEGESICHALLRCSDGIEATFRATVMSQAHLTLSADPSFRVVGTHGEIIIFGGTSDDPDLVQLKLYNHEHPGGTTILSPTGASGLWGARDPDPRTNVGFHGGYAPQWRAIARQFGNTKRATECTRVDTPPEKKRKTELTVTDEANHNRLEAALDIAVVEAMYRSISSRSWETVEDVE